MASNWIMNNAWVYEGQIYLGSDHACRVVGMPRRNLILGSCVITPHGSSHHVREHVKILQHSTLPQSKHLESIDEAIDFSSSRQAVP